MNKWDGGKRGKERMKLRMERVIESQEGGEEKKEEEGE